MDAELAQLRKKHPEFEEWSRVYPDYRLAYTGGERFVAQAGMVAPFRYSDFVTSATQGLLSTVPGTYNTPVRRFLRQFEGEPTAVYNALWQRAEYVNYLAPAIDYCLAYLHATPPNIKPREGDETPDWFEGFSRNASGSGKGLLEMARDLLRESMLTQRSGWLIGRAASVMEQGAEDETQILSPYKAEEIWDWQHSESGELEWVVLHKERIERKFPSDRYRVETITYLDDQEWTTWEISADPETKKEVLTKVGEGVHGLGVVPFVMQRLPDGLFITDKLFRPCVGLFNQWVRLKNAMTLGCVLQPYVKSSRDNPASKIIGEGILLQLHPGREGEDGEDFGWKSPDVAPLKFIWDHYKEAVAELYRTIHQMSMAVDAKSVASIARSGASKTEDRKSTEIILKGFGAIQTDTLLRVLNMVSMVYGDNTVWTLDGFDNFDIQEPLEEATFQALAGTGGVESPTFKKAHQKRWVRIFLPNEDESTMQDIDSEIDDAVEADQARIEMQKEAADTITEAGAEAAQVAAKDGMKPGVMGQEQPMGKGMTGGPAQGPPNGAPTKPTAPFPPKKKAA